MRGTVSRSVIYVARAGAESLYMMRVVPLVNAVAGSANAGLGAERWADGRTRRKAGASGSDGCYQGGQGEGVVGQYHGLCSCRRVACRRRERTSGAAAHGATAPSS